MKHAYMKVVTSIVLLSTVFAVAAAEEKGESIALMIRHQLENGDGLLVDAALASILASTAMLLWGRRMCNRAIGEGMSLNARLTLWLEVTGILISIAWVWASQQISFLPLAEIMFAYLVVGALLASWGVIGMTLLHTARIMQMKRG